MIYIYINDLYTYKEGGNSLNKKTLIPYPESNVQNT